MHPLNWDYLKILLNTTWIVSGIDSEDINVHDIQTRIISA